MTAPRDEGYILASVIGVLLAISIVAAALIGTSGESLRRVRRAEVAASRETALQSALTLVASQLVQDPRRRALKLSADRPLDVLGQTVLYRIGWENSKLDINLAEPDAIEARLQGSGLSRDTIAGVLATVRNSRTKKQPISLLSELQGDHGVQTCLASLLTVFGGQAFFDPTQERAPDMIGEPAPGSRLAIDLAISGAEAEGLSAVILITGDSRSPWQVMDWTHTSSLSGAPCHAV